MYTKEKFHDTIGILVNAYMNDTLKHMDCAACAVGNIIAAKLHCTIERNPEQRNELLWKRGTAWLEPVWSRLFFTPRPQGKQRKWPKKNKGYIKMQVDATGYTWQELALIEKAFESVNVPLFNNKLPSVRCNVDEDKWGFNGLMAVVDVLCQIHGMNEVDKKEAKELFVKV